MKNYIGTKRVKAKLMLSEEAEEVLGRDIESKYNESGYLVEYEDGYTSWSPKAVFEEAYRRVDNLPFGLAIEALKKGCWIARSGWNGKDMWLRLFCPYQEEGYKMTETSKADYTLTNHIVMKTVDNQYVPWLASQTDILAEDWVIVE